MQKETLEDGTVLITDWSEGGHVTVYCSCGVDEPIYLGDTDLELCPNCSKKYVTQFIPTIQVWVDGDYVSTF